MPRPLKHAALVGDHTPPSPWTEGAPSQFHSQPEAEKIVDPAHRDLDQRQLRELMRINFEMFEGTIRVLGDQNKKLHAQVAQLTMDNANFRQTLGAAGLL